MLRKASFCSLNLLSFFFWINVTKIKQSGPYKILINKKFSPALQQVELPSALAQVGALSMISFLDCWIFALPETNFYFYLEFPSLCFRGKLHDDKLGITGLVCPQF